MYSPSSPSPSPKSSSGRSDVRSSDFAPLAPLVVAPYLEAYGYRATDSETWTLLPGSAAARLAGVPDLGLEVAGHEEVDGHTLYTLDCTLEDLSVRTEWSTKRRLVQLREDLHDNVKSGLGDDYGQLFASAPFAHKGGVPGTTARLDSWFRTFAKCVNRGHTPPSTVALVLYFLEAPEPESCNELVQSLDVVRLAGGGRIGPPVVRQLDGSRASQSSDDGSLLDEIELSLNWGVDEGHASAMPGLAMGAAHARGDGLVLRFRLPDGAERLVDFGARRPPLGVDFRSSTPMRVARSYHFAEALGVQPGWELVAVNGRRVEGWSAPEAFKLMKVKAFGMPRKHGGGQAASAAPDAGVLPTRRWGSQAAARRADGGPSPRSASEAPSIVLSFELPDGSERAVDFGNCALPLGLSFGRKLPISVELVSEGSAAHHLGVQEGWVVVAVNGDNFRECTEFSGPYALLLETLTGAAGW